MGQIEAHYGSSSTQSRRGMQKMAAGTGFSGHLCEKNKANNEA
jgi:hypothetical protein